MRVLWLKSDYVLPADTGGKIRTYNLLRELRKRCRVTYASFRAHEDARSLPPLDACAHEVTTFHRAEEIKSGLGFYLRVLRGMRSRYPYIVQKYRSEEFQREQRRWLNDAQEPNGDGAVVVCDFLEMAENIDWSLPVPKVLFQHNVESMIWRRYRQTERNPVRRAYFGFEYKRMRAYESAACERFDLVFTVSREDKETLQREYGVTTPIEVLETGVDTQYFAPMSEVEPVPGRLVFLGSLDWMPNIDGITWFVSHVWPKVRARVPHATLDIVGRRPTPAVRKLANDASIRVLADVADVRPCVARADVFVVPLRVGGGSRIKIYEAMAMGRPVMSTRIGAEGLPLREQEHLALADEPDAWADQLAMLGENADAKTRMAERGRRFVAENFPWSRVSTRLFEECQELARGTASTVASKV